jgi:hypothetical protein
VRVGGVPSDCSPAALLDLVRAGYRYVVWHKPAADPPPNVTWAEEDAGAFVQAALGQRAVLEEDALVRVWSLPPADQALPGRPVIELWDGWYGAEQFWRWASSPASIRITAPAAGRAALVVYPQFFYDPAAPRGLGRRGVLTLRSASGDGATVAARVGEPARLPIDLTAGPQIVTLSLEAGSFRPQALGERDPRTLSFAVRFVDLELTPP